MKRLILLAATLFIATSIIAQGMPGGGGGGRPRGAREGNMPRKPDPAQVAPVRGANADAISTLYQELPSLKADLMLSPEQTRLWDAFALAVRDVRDIQQGRIRRETAARISSPAGREALEKNPPPATSLFNTLADEDRQRADAMDDAKVKAAVLIGALTTEQKKMFDRRIALSQADPLGAY